MKESCQDGVTHEAQKWQCLHCRKVLKSRSGLKIHLQIHSVDKYFCMQCGTAFSRSSHLKRHQLVHSGAKLYTCSQCGKTFSRRDGLKRHQEQDFGAEEVDSMLHEDADHIKSEIVMVKITEDNTDIQLSSTMEGFCPPSEQLNSSVCLLSKQCKSEADDVNVEQHSQLLVHSSEKRYRCNECGKGFSEASDLDLHNLINCGTQYSQSSWSFSAVKPYKCSECGKSCSTEEMAVPSMQNGVYESVGPSEHQCANSLG
ncbi:hypothetical protein Z043_116159 [Scleropages formosus]|uniref:C2H2-type domain-containing protein n=1 Tax=Scleropages formosus TaxID=113540 RepID=A0A0P7UU24_SCLFO|nr:hypothetical protein Z043_116159 [Scleropages formosus]